MRFSILKECLPIATLILSILNFILVQSLEVEDSVNQYEDIPLESHRKSKYFMRVSVPPEPCGNDDSGVCLSKKKCSKKDGVTGNSCASTFGECCTFTETCNSTRSTIDITEYVTVLKSPSPISTPCTYRIRKQRGVCQVLLQFKSFSSASANTDGICDTDSLTIRNSITVEDGFTTCGQLTGQHMYLSFGNADSIEVRPWFTRPNGDYNIVATQIPCSSSRRVPDYCLQHYNTTTGTVKSFDWPTQQQSNQMYTVCVNNLVGRGSINWKRCTEAINAPGIDKAFLIASNPCGLARTNDWVQINGKDRMCDFTAGAQGVSSPWVPFLLNVNFDGHEVPPLPWLDDQAQATSATCTALGDLYPFLDACAWDIPSESCQCAAVPGAVAMFPPPDIGNTGFCLDFTQM